MLFTASRSRSRKKVEVKIKGARTTASLAKKIFFTSNKYMKRELTVISLRHIAYAACPVCEKQVELLSIEGAAIVFKTDTQDIEFLAKRGDLHRVHNRAGKVMICSNSLFECFESRQTRLLASHFVENTFCD